MAAPREFRHPGDNRIPALRCKRALGLGDDEAIARLAANQQGRVARRQLIALGITHQTIVVRRRRGTLREVHRGVYAVGHAAPTREADWQAAVLATGPGCALSHLSAAELWRLIPYREGHVHVTVNAKRRRQSGIVAHRAGLHGDEVTAHNGIPVTTVPRTLLDLATYLGSTGLRRAIRQCEYLSLASLHEVGELLARYPNRRGRARLRRALEGVQAAPGYTRSVLEEEFLSLVEEVGLPAPELNGVLVLAGKQIEVDCLWRTQRLAVELDGGQAHKTEFAFEEDRRRDRALIAAGFTPMRVTWTSLRSERSSLGRDLHAAWTTHAGKPVA
jgi:predicted transcriptional regulator of viral defense system